MKFLYESLVGLHMLGILAIAWGLFSARKSRGINTAMLHGVSTQILTGVLMVGLAESGAVDETLDMVKVTVKLAIAVAMLVIIVKGRRATGDTKNLWLTVGALWLTNIVIAVAA